MREFKSLKPKGLPDGYDVDKQTESPIVNVEQTENKIVISYTFPGFYLVDDAALVKGKKVQFKRTHIEAVGFFAQSGKPLLPAFSRYVKIPQNSKWTMSVKKEQEVQFDNVLIAPAQEKLVDDFPQRDHVFEYDETFYETDEFYPKEIAELKGPVVIEGVQAYLLSVRPLQYNPAKKKLVGYGNVVITIDFSPAEGGIQPKDVEFTGNNAVSNLFLNAVSPAILAVYRLREPFLFKFAPSFLIIYADGLKAVADKLAFWKRKCGLTTSTVSILDIGNTVDNIKAYIRARTPPTGTVRYVLLMGDTSTIVNQSYPPWDYRYIDHLWTDFYYSTSTNKEDPKPVGAPGYIFPKIAIGRIPTADPTLASAIVDKIIAYEKTPPTNQSYYNSITLAASFEDEDTPPDGQDNRGYLETIQKIYDFFAADPKYILERVYVSTNNGNENFYYSGAPIPASVKSAFTTSASTATTNLKNAVTNGRHFIAHRDHGDINGWVRPSFKTADVATLNSSVPSILYSINCLTGAFGPKGPRPNFINTDCFAEALLKLSNGGAPSLIAATDLSPTWLNNDLMFALFDAMYGGMLPTFPGMAESYPNANNRIGDILNYAKYYLPIGRSGGAGDSNIVTEFEEYHVLGDPTLEIWTDLPKKIKLVAALTLNSLQIKLSHCPPGSRITIWSKDRLLKTLSPTTTTLSVSTRGTVITRNEEILWPSNLTSLVVCFKAPGYAFTQTSVRKTPFP